MEVNYIIAVVVLVVAALLIKKFMGCLVRIVIAAIAIGIIALCLMLNEHPKETLNGQPTKIENKK